jgi:hypothetical protein
MSMSRPGPRLNDVDMRAEMHKDIADLFYMAWRL